MNGPANQNMRPGDWLCFDCNYVNFASRKECNRCKTKKPDNYGAPIAPMMKDMYGMPPQRLDQQKEVRPNDWECPDCNVSNFENRDACFKCNIPKPENAILTISLKNWECGQCFASNHAKRRECFKCQCSKPEDAKEIESLKDWFCPSCSHECSAKNELPPLWWCQTWTGKGIGGKSRLEMWAMWNNELVMAKGMLQMLNREE